LIGSMISILLIAGIRIAAIEKNLSVPGWMTITAKQN
jgi:hypothetical protein